LQDTPNSSPEVAPAGSRIRAIFQVLPFHFSASGPPVPRYALPSRPTATQFFGDTHDTPNSSFAGGVAAGTAVAWAPVTWAAATRVAVTWAATAAAGAVPNKAIGAMSPNMAAVRI
jgi:hypothetical protein